MITSIQEHPDYCNFLAGRGEFIFEGDDIIFLEFPEEEDYEYEADESYFMDTVDESNYDPYAGQDIFESCDDWG